MEQGQKKSMRNDYGVQIVKACFSCKFARSLGAKFNTEKQLRTRMCTLKDECNDRCHLCDSWQPQKRYEVLGSGRTATGSHADPGNVKDGRYLRWLASNHKDSRGVDRLVTESRAAYLAEERGRKIYLTDKLFPNFPR